jgi:coniferyl-aldehyde dehydrogenase
VFLPENAVPAFVAHCKRLFAQRFPDINNDDYTAIIDQRSYDRLQDALDDASRKGAVLINLAEGQQADAGKRKFAPHIVLEPTDDMILSQREIFGPILPIRTYRSEQEVANFINSGDRPLAIYPFTNSKTLQRFYISHIMSGGVSVNEALLHVAQHDLPFGGVGASGMGHYHAKEGFMTFSKLRPVFYQGPLSFIQILLQPPYARKALRLVNLLIRLKT